LLPRTSENFLFYCAVDAHVYARTKNAPPDVENADA
jgi:hypothetical protein